MNCLADIPYDEWEGLIRLAFTAVLLAIVLVLSYMKRIGIGKDAALSSARGFAQLMILAIIFTYIFDSPDWLLYTWILFIAMCILAGYTSARRAKQIPKAWQITTPSIVIGTSITLIIMLLTEIMISRPEFIIPLAGMAFGNTMNLCSLCLNRIIGEVKNNRARIEAALALGATSDQAIDPYIQTSVKAAMIPSIDSIKTLGVIFIPGAMAGLLMAGTEPLVAAEYQIAVFFMIFSAGIITAITVSSLARKRLFTEAHQLKFIG
ncbi:MAG: hypothetical protein AYK23_05005 [Candidatus Proteinoplasmatales archaeon SG8-5]|nr:MAG: hypothetical protein AYK23_05005 [Candidatus Proteinoplasmatales archaeon SG8-5]